MFDRFSYYARREHSWDHNKQVCTEYLNDLQEFVESRVGNTVQLNIPGLEKNNLKKSTTTIVEELTVKGWYKPDWNTTKLSLPQIRSAVDSMAVLHAAWLAFRMSMKNNFEQCYPWLMEDLYTSNMAKELIAKHLDSYLHCLSFLTGT